MTYDVSKLPAVRAQLERDLARREKPDLKLQPAMPEYVRAPAGAGGGKVTR
jgi:hypothetical protein